MDTEPSLVLKA